MPATSPIIIPDAGPLVALADAPDPHHEWAATLIAATDRPFIVTSAAVAEATHMLKNGPRALVFLEKLVTQMNVEDPAPVAVLAEMRRWGQRMDYADACAVLLARRHKGAGGAHDRSPRFFGLPRALRVPAGRVPRLIAPMKFPLYSRVALTVDLPAEGVRRGDVATIVEHHSAPAAGIEPGYSVEVFNAIGETLAVVTLPESSLEALRRDEVLSVRSLTSHAA